MYAITVSELSLSFGATPILDKVSFALEETDRLGIIGVNGCGKSTLFKLITGELEPTEGSIFLSKGKTVGILTQEGAFSCDDEEQTVLDLIYRAFPHLLAAEARLAELERDLKGADPRVIREYTDLHDAFVRDGGLEFRGRCISILRKLGFDEYADSQKISTLSGGQRTRLALAVQLSREPDILLLDEPTNHLDIATLSWLESFLSNYKKCFMVISHDRYFLDRVTNKTLAIENRHARLYQGGYTKSMKQRETDREIAERHWKNQQKEIARQEAYIAQQRAWNRERNIIAAESRQKLLDKMERVERPENAPKGIKLRFSEALASGNDVLEARGLTMGFPNRPLFRDLSFLVKRGERVLIIGPNGCGKSTLIKLILSQLSPTAGVLSHGYNVEVGYYDQENQNLTPENTVLDELWNAYPTRTETEIRQVLGMFRFTGETVFKTVSVLSGGERARLTLAKLMLSRMNLLVLDEPTNHLDMNSREALEEAVALFDGTVITVSHDRYLIDKLATRILELKPGACFAGDLLDYRVEHPGRGYTEFMEYKTARISEREPALAATLPSTAPSATSNKEQYLKQKQAASDARRKKARMEKLQKECAELEKRIEEIDAELFGDAAADYLRAAELDAEKARAEERLMEIYEALEDCE
ncbi:MAG: ABC-F family ATP-binding cassette domain-containing protein [Ruminococcaceae bacterium]|nr:ABC-F family ATP-binding cassette domain-containing protein [Oscillospiraceae bacterium]